MTQASKPRIYYVFDPMCGWCYGFSSVMDKFERNFHDSIDFDIISGGMVVGEREGPVGDFADYILSAFPRVEEYSGIKFGQPYIDQLKTKKLWSSSVMPAIAIETFKHFKPESAIPFASAVQKKYFDEGKDLRDDAVYKDLIKPYGIDEEKFIAQLHSEEMRTAAFAGFQQSNTWGITGFPAVIIEVEGKLYLIAKGFTDYDTLVRSAQGAIAEHGSKAK